MSWSIWQTLRARDAAVRPRAEPPAPPRMNHAAAPSPKVLHEIFRPALEESADPAPCVSQPKEAQVP